MQWIAAILFLSLLVVVHEFGHYIVAKMCGMRVNTFSLGFGPALIKWKWRETTFQIGPIFFGGYVWIDGMNIMEEIDPNDRHAYPNRPTWQRFLVIAAGPFANFLFAIAIGFGFYVSYGQESPNELLRVASVQTGWDVDGKLEPGDTVLSINGENAWALFDGEASTVIAEQLEQTNGAPATVAVMREKTQLIEVETVSPQQHQNEDGSKRWVLGINYHPGHATLGGLLYRKRSPLTVTQSAKAACLYPYLWSKRIVGYLWEKAKKREKPELGSAPRIAKEIKRATEKGWLYILPLLMYLNVSLGLFNLFPIPALDGGRLIFLGYELITRRRPNQKIEAYVTMFGFLLIFLLLILVTVNDIRTW